MCLQSSYMYMYMYNIIQYIYIYVKGFSKSSCIKHKSDAGAKCAMYMYIYVEIKFVAVNMKITIDSNNQGRCLDGTVFTTRNSPLTTKLTPRLRNLRPWPLPFWAFPWAWPLASQPHGLCATG